MTPTSHRLDIDATVPDNPTEPDLLEVALWARGLKLLFWTVDDPEQVDADEPESALVATLRVVWFNGRRVFTSDVVLDYDVIHALVGSDEVSGEATDAALGEILGRASEIDPAELIGLEDDPSWASASSTRELSDGDMLRGAACLLETEWGALMDALATLVDQLPPGLSYASPKSRVASIAVQIAWDLL